MACFTKPSCESWGKQANNAAVYANVKEPNFSNTIFAIRITQVCRLLVASLQQCLWDPRLVGILQGPKRSLVLSEPISTSLPSIKWHKMDILWGSISFRCPHHIIVPREIAWVQAAPARCSHKKTAHGGRSLALGTALC